MINDSIVLANVNDLLHHQLHDKLDDDILLLLLDKNIPIEKLTNILKKYRSIKNKLDYSAPECLDEIFKEWNDIHESFQLKINKTKNEKVDDSINIDVITNPTPLHLPSIIVNETNTNFKKKHHY